MSEWPVVRLETLAADEKSAISKPYGSAIVREDYVPEGVPVVRGVNLARGRFHDDDFVFITEDLADRMPGSRLHAADLVFTHRGSVGQVSIIPRTPRYERYAVSTSQVKARLDPTRAVPEFFYYWFRSPAGQHSILRGSSTVGVPGLAQPVATVKSLQVPSPPVPEQRRIASVLGALDDLIEANREAIGKVQELSTTLYQKLAAETDTDVALGDVARVSDMKTRPAHGPIRYIDIAAMGDGSFEMPERIDWSKAPSRARMKAVAGSTLWSTVRPNRRAHALLVEAPDDLVVSTGIAVLTPTGIGPAELFAAADQDGFVDQLVAKADGSAYPAVRPSAFTEVRIAALDPEPSAQFERALWPLWLDAHAAMEDIERLTRTRDELLPLLMSGKVRVLEDLGVA